MLRAYTSQESHTNHCLRCSAKFCFVGSHCVCVPFLFSIFYRRGEGRILLRRIGKGWVAAADTDTEAEDLNFGLLFS